MLKRGKEKEEKQTPANNSEEQTSGLRFFGYKGHFVRLMNITFRRGKSELADKPGSVLDSHSSRACVTTGLKQPTRIQRGPRQRIPIWSCSRWGLPSPWTVASHAVRSYRTISPLPADEGAEAGSVLLHFPPARAAQALPGTLPCGARTFLPR